jgi:hypothetical protein
MVSMGPEDHRAAKALVLAMETCHICSGTVLLDEWPVHCEDCSADCEEHEPPDCPTIQSLHAALKKALSTSKQEISG